MMKTFKVFAGCVAVLVVGIVLAAWAVSSFWPSGKFPGGQATAPTTVAPAAAEPATTAPPTTQSVVASLPEPSAESRQIVALNDLAVSQQAELAAIPADQTALRQQKLDEYSKVRALKSEAELAAVTKPRFVMTWFNWLMLGGMMVMITFVVVLTIFSIRRQKRMEALQVKALGMAEDEPSSSTPAPAPKLQAVKPPPSQPETISDLLGKPEPAVPVWHAEFDAEYRRQPTHIQEWMWAQRRSWPPGQEERHWAKLSAVLSESAAS